MTAHSFCGFVPVGSDWGYLDGPSWHGSCEHISGERNCDSCSRTWYRVGNDSTHDYEVTGDPPRYTGGPSSEECPECKEAA